jgi:hypothetical protein
MWHPLRTGIILVCCFLLYLPGAVIGQVNSDADTREVSQYILTEGGLAKFGQAAKNLASVPGYLAAGCDDEEGASTLDGMVAKIESVAGAKHAIESAGMPVREFVVFLISAVQTGIAVWALDQPGGAMGPGVSRANVDFYRSHQRALEEAAGRLQADDCDDEDSDDYGEDEDTQ